MRSRQFKKSSNRSFLNTCLSMCIRDAAMDSRLSPAPGCQEPAQGPAASKKVPLVPAEPAKAPSTEALHLSAEGKENSAPCPAPHEWEQVDRGAVEPADDFVLVDAAA